MGWGSVVEGSVEGDKGGELVNHMYKGQSCYLLLSSCNHTRPPTAVATEDSTVTCSNIHVDY